MKNKIKFFANSTPEAEKVLKEVKEVLTANGFVESDDAKTCIAIGGDGSFLRMITAENFNSKNEYVGINAGTLGFLQTIMPSEIEHFAKNLKSGKLKKEDISYLNCTILYGDKTKTLNCLNEIVLRDKNYNKTKLNIFVNNNKLETLVGDGVLICSSVGSTAYSLNLGGSIIPHNFSAMQITPIAPMQNKVFKTLKNSVILLENSTLELLPTESRDDLIIHRDGEKFEFDDIKKVIIKLSKNKLTCLSLEHHSFYQKVSEKLLGE